MSSLPPQGPRARSSASLTTQRPAGRAHCRRARPLRLHSLRVHQPRHRLRRATPVLQAHDLPRRQAQVGDDLSAVRASKRASYRDLASPGFLESI